MPRISLLRAFAALGLLLPAASAYAQISYTGASLTQDFNSLVNTGTSSTLPAGWALAETGSGANATYGADNGSTVSGNTYSYGTTGSTDRAFGGLQSGSVTPVIGVQLSNATGAAINTLPVSFTGEQWRLGTVARTDRMDFQYSTDATSLTTGTWTHVDALDFTAPVTSGATGLLDGNHDDNNTAVSAQITGLNVPNGQTLWLRWTDLNATSSDDGLAIDDVVIGTATDVPPTVASSVPANGELDVPIDTSISITFSEPVDVTGTWFSFVCTGGAPTLTASAGPATTFTLTPSTPLGYSRGCNLAVFKDQVHDRDGTADAMADDAFISFDTIGDNPPEVSTSTPLDTAVDVARAANLSVTFNEPVTAPAAAFGIFCPDNAASSLPFVLSSEDDTVFTFDPSADLPASTACRLFVDSLQVTDHDGAAHNLASDARINFTTAALAPPAIVSTVPGKNATNFPSAGDLQVVFDASVTLGPGVAFTLSCAQSTGISLSHASSGSSFTIGTGTALVAGDTCTFTIEADAITSGDGLHPVDDEIVSFTVATLGPGNYYAGVDASSCAVLRTTLHAKIDDHTVFPYTGAPTDVWTLIETGDQDPNDSGRVLDVYFNKSFAKGADRDNGTSQPQGTKFNREHTWPQSLGFAATNGDLGFPNAPRSDGHMIYASEKDWNADRGNKPFANCPPPGCASRHTLIHSVTGGAGTAAACDYASGNCNWVQSPDGNTGSFEVWTRRKGDVARAVLYMDIRYEGGVATGGNTQGQSEPDLIVTDNRNLIQITSSSPAYMGLKSTLLAWHALDPPDAHEQLRNEAIFSFQGNRNPFIDHPEWAECLFNCTCTPPNAPPVAVADAPAAVVEDSGSNTIDVLANDTDSDGGPKTVVSVTQPVGGVAAVGAGGANVTFTPNLNFCASTSFTYALNGGSIATVSLTMTCLNDAPTANDAAFSLPENSVATTAVGTVVASDPDAGASLTYAITAGNGSGAFAMSGNQVVVANAAPLNFEVTPQFVLTVTVSDGSLSDPAQVTVNLSNVNEAPTANDATYALAENSAATTVVGTVTANDPDAGASLTYSITAGNGSGAFAMSGNQVVVANAAPLNFEVTPQFVLTVTASDGSLSDPAQVTVNLSNVNEAPTVSDDTFSLPENSAVTTVVGQVAASDVDAGTTLGYSITAGNGSGAFAISASGQITVANATPLDFETTPQFVLTVTVTDNAAPSAATDTATITINLSNLGEGSAMAANDTANATEDGGQIGIAVLTNDTPDPDGGAFDVIGVDDPANGSASFTATSVNYTPDPQFCGTDSFGYTISGNIGATITVTVACVNDAPTTAGALSAQTAQEGVAIVPFSIAAGFTDIDAGDDLDYSQTGLPAGLTLDTETGAISGTPSLGSAAGSVYTVTITATDGESPTQPQQSFQYTVTPAAPSDPHIFGSGFEG